jgi:O-antigen ligase
MENIIVGRSGHYRVLFVALLIFVLALPLSKSISSITLGLLYAYCIAIITFDRNFRRTIFRHLKQPLNISILLFVLFVLIRSLFSKEILDGLSFVKQVSNLFIVYVVVAVFLDTEKDEGKRRKKVESLLLCFIAGIFTLDMLGLLTYAGVIGSKKHILPVTPLGMHHIWAGNLNAVGLYGAAGLLLFSPQRNVPRSLSLSLFIIVGLISVLLSTSRTAWVGIFVAVIISGYFVIQNKRAYFMTAVAAIAGCAALYLFNTIIHARINKIFDDLSLFLSGISSTSIGLRLLMWKEAMEMFLSNPLFGVGPGDYKTTVSTFVAAGRFPGSMLNYNQPHNVYFFSLATTGLAGLSTLLFIFYKTLRYSGRLLRNKERLLGFLALSVCVHFMTAGFTESLLNIHVLISSFALISGLCIRRSSIEKAEQG